MIEDTADMNVASTSTDNVDVNVETGDADVIINDGIEQELDEVERELYKSYGKRITVKWQHTTAWSTPVNVSASSVLEPIDYFHRFIDDEVLQMML